ncbi:serine/threonine protein kinase [Myxococcota bacterium]
MTELPETLRGGRYAVVRLLGQGTQGETLEAVDKRVGRWVAIKRFRVRGAPSWKSVELAEREARVLAHLAHPALPGYVEHFEEEGALYLVMEKIEGESVARLLRQGKTFSQADVVRFLREASDVLDYLHGRAPPIIHRDLKPGNVLVRTDGSFAWVDFGSVRDSLQPEGGSTVVGTFGYMAPEQFQGRAQPASDVYAVGVTALTMLTRREPETLPHRGLAIDVRSALGNQVYPELVQVLAAILEPDPDRRPARLAPWLARLPAPPSARAHRTAQEPLEPTERAHFQSADGADWRAPPSARPPIGQERWKAAQKAGWHHTKTAGRAHWHPMSPVPPVFLVFAHFGLSVAEILLSLLFRLVAPLVLTLLSLFLGPRLRHAAEQVRQLGEAILAALARARETLERPRAPTRLRVANSERPRPPTGVPEDEAADSETLAPGQTQGVDDANFAGERTARPGTRRKG